MLALEYAKTGNSFLTGKQGQNQKMPVRALRPSNTSTTACPPSTVSESKNARKGIKTTALLNSRAVVSVESESKNARKGIKTRNILRDLAAVK